MKKSFCFLAMLLLAVSLSFSQSNTLDNLSLSASSPAQVAYGLRQLSTTYTGYALRVRRASDNAEAYVAFDGSTPPKVSTGSNVTLVPAVTLTTGFGTTGAGTITTTAAKSGTITVAVLKTGNITATLSSTIISGSSTQFLTDGIAANDLIYTSTNVFLGVVKSVTSNTSLTLKNNTIAAWSGTFRTQKANVTGSGTNFTAELSDGDRIYTTAGAYIGTVYATPTSATSMFLYAWDATAQSSTGFQGTSATVTGSGTSFTSPSMVGKMLISDNKTIGIVESVESATSLTLATRAGAPLSGQSFTYSDGTITFSTFYGSSDVYVKTWYDQSGNGRNAIQNTPANQPRIVKAGVLNVNNSRPTIEFNGTLSNRFLQTAASASWLTNTLYTQNIVSSEVTPITTYQFVLSTTGGNGPNNTIMHYGYRGSTQYTVAQYGNDQNFEVFASNTLELHTAVKNTISSSQFYQNGAFLGTLTSSAGSHLSDLGLLNIGNYTPTGNYYKGSVSELTVYSLAIVNPDLDSLKTNQLAYYGISTANWVGGNPGNPTEWNEPNNWSPATVPIASTPTMVVIPNGRTYYPIITSAQTYAAMNIVTESAASLTVEGTLQVYGTLSNSGANRVNATNGTIEYRGGMAQSILANTFTSNAVKNLVINTTNGSNVSMTGGLTISNNLTFTSGKLIIGPTTLTLGGSVTNTVSGGLRGSSNSSLVITGTPTLSFDNSSAGVNDLLRNLTINSSGVVTMASNLYINNNSTGLTLTSGKLAIGSNTLNIIGGVVNTVSEGLRGSSSSNLTITGATNRTLSFDQTTPGATNLLNNFSVNTTSANTITVGNALSVNGTLTTAAGQTLNLGTNVLGGALSTVANNGTITTANTSSTPLPTGKTWGGTVVYNGGTSAQTAMAGIYNNLTISTTGGATASGDITVNGVLSLAANPSETKGNLEMVTNYNNYPRTTSVNTYVPISSNILTMGANATTIGLGDVTGKIYRSSLLANTAYTFGNQYTTYAYTVAPTSVTVIVTIGTAYGDGSTWGNSSAVKRSYEMVPAGGTGARVDMNLHYLESELNGNTEDKLVTGDFDVEPAGAPLGDEHGRSSYDYTNNYIGLNGVPISYFIYADPGHKWYTIFNLHNYGEGHTTWDGSESDAWMTDLNWSNGIPGEAMTAIIPDAATTPHDPVLAANKTVGGMQILSGGILNLNGETITLNPTIYGNGWEDQSGLSNYTGSTVVIANTGWSTPVIGIPHFDNLTINSGAGVTVGSNSHIYISGTITKSGSFNASTYANTVEFNKAGDQTILLPDNGRYSGLTLSGSGTKNLPALTSIDGSLTLSGSVVTGTSSAQSILGNFFLGSGTTFTAGSLSHSIGGNFENNGGTFNITGSTFTFNGSSAQTLGGTTTPSAFNDMTISNASGVTLLNNTTTAALTISSGALTVTAGKNLTASGTTTLGSAECLVLASNAAGTASFIDNGTISGAGTARVERYLTSYTVVPDQKFHFLASPVGNAQSIDPEFADTTSSDITDFYKWDEPSNTWINYRGQVYNQRNPDFGDDFKLVTGKGYLVAYPAAVTKKFLGAPYTSADGLQITCTNTGNHGWNLLGNPFPSSLDWTLVTKENGIDNALYFYNNDTQQYRYYLNLTGGLGDATQYIPPMQGFMVHAKSTGTKTLTLANSARVHDGQNVYYKEANLTTNILDLKVEGNKTTDYARVCFYEPASEGFDGEFDAYKLFSYSQTSSELYTSTPSNTNLAINTLPASMLKGDVNLNFKPGEQSSFTITAQKISTFNGTTAITLEDKTAGKTQRLDQNPVYAFTAAPNDNPNRFVLHFGGTIGVDHLQSTIKPALIYANGNTLIIKSNKSTPLTGEVHVFNMLGQMIARGKMDGDLYKVTLCVPSGWYIVTLVYRNEIFSQKILVN